jgi:hypothetical protein
MQRLANGEAVAAHEYYFRTAIRFFTASHALNHLNQMLALSFGERHANKVHLTIFPVL